MKKRYSQNPADTSLFVCDNRSEDYDTPENLVLKRLILDYLRNNRPGRGVH